MELLIHAPNVHQGGGRSLLVALLAASRGRPVRANVDARLRLPPDVPDSCILARVPPTLAGRLAAEWRLRSGPNSGRILLCFGNLPPLFGDGGADRTVLFLQNRLLLTPSATAGLPVRVRLRIRAERVWLRRRLARVNRVIVQTPSMAHHVREALGVEASVLPFAPSPPRTVPRAEGRASGDAAFLYVASGEPHKNHERLLEAWRLLAGEEIRPTLWLTVAPDRYPALAARIDASGTRDGLDVRNLGHLDPDALEERYGRAAALIYPSNFESYGLPLLEAHARGLPILASELDYVRDLIDPAETFDPQSPLSIARAVKRFLGRRDTRGAILDPGQFLDAVLAEVGGRR